MEKVKSDFVKQRMRYDEANKNFSEAHQNALKFNPNTNQVEDYNSLRKVKSTFEFTHRRKPKEQFSNMNSYQMMGDILSSNVRNKNFKDPTITLKPNATRFENLPEHVEYYKSADGTQYKIYNAPGHAVKEIDYPSKNVIHVPGKYHELYRQSATSEEVPQNIKHKFGSRTTNELLKDELKVHDTLSFLNNSGINKKNDKTENGTAAIDLNKPNALDTQFSVYYDIGNHLRHAVCHGWPTVVKKSSKEEVHNAELSKEFLSDPKNVESPWRRKKDWLGN